MQTSSMSLPFCERFADPTWFPQQQGEYLQLELLQSGQELEDRVNQLQTALHHLELRLRELETRLDQVLDFNLVEHQRNFYR